MAVLNTNNSLENVIISTKGSRNNVSIAPNYLDQRKQEIKLRSINLLLRNSYLVEEYNFVTRN